MYQWITLSLTIARRYWEIQASKGFIESWLECYQIKDIVFFLKSKSSLKGKGSDSRSWMKMGIPVVNAFMMMNCQENTCWILLKTSGVLLWGESWDNLKGVQALEMTKGMQMSLKSSLTMDIIFWIYKQLKSGHEILGIDRSMGHIRKLRNRSLKREREGAARLNKGNKKEF